MNKIDEVTEKALSGNYIYRGESRINDKVSSRLYRETRAGGLENIDVEFIQNTELYSAKRFTTEEDDLLVLAEIQHYGGATNLIDFTTDYLIALFFACDGDAEEDGRVIFASPNFRSSGPLHKPRAPMRRVIAQKSVFARPPTGFIEDDEIERVRIPSRLKREILDFLRRGHGISAETIFNDLHGYIRQKSVHEEAKKRFLEGVSLSNKGNSKSAIERYTESISLNPEASASFNNRGFELLRTCEIEHAIRDFDSAIERDSRDGMAFFNRATALMASSRWEESMNDLTTARNLGFDVDKNFYEDHMSVEDFEKKYSVTLPEDIVTILTGR